jgi:MFS family permease
MAVRFTTPTQSGIDIFPVTCLLVPGSIVVSFLASRLGRFRWAIWSGWVFSVAGCALLVLLDLDTDASVWATVLAIFGIGNGMVLTSVNVAIQAISHVENCGRAASMYAFMRSLGMALGVAVGGTVFQNVMSAKLDDEHLPEAIAHNAEAFVGQLVKLLPTDPTRIGALQAYLSGFRGVFWTMTAVAGAALVASFVIRRHSMDKILESKYTLDGGAGSGARAKVDTMERKAKAMSMAVGANARRASKMLFPSSPMPAHVVADYGCRTTIRFSMESNSDMIPLRHLADEPPRKGSLTDVGSIKAAKRTSTLPPGFKSRPKSVQTLKAQPIDVAPAVAFYVAPGGKKMPVAISSSTMEI